MQYEWDINKSATNIRKHGVDFADATTVLEDELAMTVRDPDSAGEERFITIGCDPYGRILVVVFTWRGENIRLISARKATSKERRRYESKS